jgi:hypothetical protein
MDYGDSISHRSQTAPGCLVQASFGQGFSLAELLARETAGPSTPLPIPFGYGSSGRDDNSERDLAIGQS